MPVKFAFSRPTASEDEAVRLFNGYVEAGYGGLQLKAGQYAPYVKEPERFLEKWGRLKGAGSALIAGGSLDKESLGRLRELFRFGRAIGTELIVFCHGVPRSRVTADDIRNYADVLSDTGEEAQNYGLKLSLHHHYDQPVMHREDFDRFYDRVREGTVGLTIDTAHLVKSGIEDCAEVIRSFKTVIDNYHLKDFADGEWQVLGRGRIDFGPIFEAIARSGYGGWVSADEESGGGIEEGMAECLAFMKRGFGASL
ncbi:sugar phosphate isomerase/epimerase family protein [Paenibacillus arenilitoris]|uniref:TIM barrel protein n=1 Tax=Paenibacillus arenilitoris TaxID=2772299 RepID=A0A927CFV2_9BACL|nr:sugar phosphate isomerase/epimerase [Paenibacillus arenilitoris]MBD2867314.1 TIM barrel protein [Paenibacillus arenilitoris]